MSLHFEFAAAGRIIFGAGMLKEAGPIAAALGRKALLVTGRDSSRAAPLLKLLTVSYTTFSVAGEPTVQIVTKGVQYARVEGCDIVIGFGGGS
ncbi:MAG TPA: iron-containing alcohol dehydrogenase, partial [Verrucomicrobiae bacterium]|nr:iron-containing alcohol dehydrogenase [Verrucomicrobiae bacterium]